MNDISMLRSDVERARLSGGSKRSFRPGQLVLAVRLGWLQARCVHGEFRGEFRSLRSLVESVSRPRWLDRWSPVRASSPRWLLVALTALAVGACGSPPKPAKQPRGPGEWRDTKIVHEACDTEGEYASGVDLNGDGRSDLRRVVVGGQERCRALDLNLDGRIDVWVYLDASGKVRRRETDYDRDGRIDEIALFRGGQLAERQRATTLRGALDTWNYFEGGRLVKSLRDSDGDEIIDQWWEYPKQDAPECALVHSDVDHDGRPDPGSTIDLCADSALDTGEMYQEQPERLTPSQLPVQLEEKTLKEGELPEPGGAVETQQSEAPTDAKPARPERAAGSSGSEETP